MDTSKILKSKLQRVTVGASAAKTVVEEYVDGHNRRTIKQKGNQRLMKDRAYLNRLSKLVNTYSSPLVYAVAVAAQKPCKSKIALYKS